MFGALTYVFMGTGKLQSWADPEKQKSEVRQTASDEDDLPYCQYDTSKSLNRGTSYSEHTGAPLPCNWLFKKHCFFFVFSTKKIINLLKLARITME